MATKAEEFFDEIVVEDKDEMESIGEMANKVLYDTLLIHLGNPAVPIAIYRKTFEAIWWFLQNQENTNSSLRINIANRLEIGFTTTFDTVENEDLEKSGNFMIYMKHLENNSLTELDTAEHKALVRCTQWAEANVTTSIDAIKKIATKSLELIRNDLDLPVANPELIIPMFCIIHENIVDYARLKRAQEDKFELVLNVAGCYDLYVRMLEDGEDISFKPRVFQKGALKQDSKASKDFEN